MSWTDEATLTRSTMTTLMNGHWRIIMLLDVHHLNKDFALTL
jgi:hypothetical protein